MPCFAQSFKQCLDRMLEASAFGEFNHNNIFGAIVFDIKAE